MNIHVPSLQRSLSDVVAEYDTKLAALSAELEAFRKAGTALKMAACVAGVYGDTRINTGDVGERELKVNLLKSAWKHVYEGLQIDRIASAKDKARWKSALENPAPFTLDNVRGTFGNYIQDPRGNILRGLAEVFCSLDQAYKSHDKVKIGVAGLPKRVILTSVGYSDSYGRQKLRDMLNAIAAYRGEPLTEYKDFDELDKLHHSFKKTSGECVIRGLRIKKFGNGNAHVMFDKATLRDVNKALAEFYGDVLPDAAGDKPTTKQASTAVAKDFQFYGTPPKLVDDILKHRFSSLTGKRILEPSCGDGAIMAGLWRAGARDVYGVEVDPGRAAQARKMHFAVLTANFLDTDFSNPFDMVVMNPPFYGKHYAKHVLHAFKFLKPGGTLVAILPATARYDHGLLDQLVAANSGRYSSPWDDLPVGSFSASGTNINTTVLTLTKREEAK